MEGTAAAFQAAAPSGAAKPPPVDYSTLSMEEKKRVREEIRQFTDSVRKEFVGVDQQNLLAQHEQTRKSLAVKDIVKSNRLPFSTAVDEVKLPYIARPAMTDPRDKFKRLNSAASVTSGSTFKNSTGSGQAFPRPEPINTDFTPGNPPFNLDQPSQSLSSHSFYGLAIGNSLASVDPLNESVESSALSTRRMEAKLQDVLELMNKASQHVNPTKLMFEAAAVFDSLKMYDRAAYCYNKATICADAAAIVDTEVLPHDDKYKRKVERMSPSLLPGFLQNQALLRDQLIHDETERQRLCKVLAHFRLTRLYLLTNVKDLYKAHDHLTQAFLLCKGEQEHVEYLVHFHQLLVRYSNAMAGKADFSTYKQVLRSSAGPIADDHLTILLDLERVNPEDPTIHEWIGMRYAEKSDIANSQHHYKIARDLREAAETRGKEIGNCTYTGENNQLLISQRTEELIRGIASNVRKAAYKEYGTDTEMTAKQVAQYRRERRERDYAWFSGKHPDTNVTIYRPPPQGWG